MNTTRQGLLCLFALLFLFPPAGLCQDAAAKKRAAEEDICEAVIRKQMEDWYRNADKSEAAARGTTGEATAKRMNFKIFFVSTDGKDPSDEFVKRLQGIPRTVKKVSRSRAGKRWRTAVLDKSTGRRGIIFNAGTIRWLSTDHVEVKGGYYCDSTCAALMVFDVHRENGRWVVKGERTVLIS
jgi:hypothetical protein